jgi:hypothetical protein
MRLFAILLLSTTPLLFAQASDENDAVGTVQKLFNAMAAHDGATIRSVLLPDASLYSVRDQRDPTHRTGEEFANQIASSKSVLQERFTGHPNVLIRGRMAQVWGVYEFLLDGKFTHCGVDSVNLFKTADGWKISTIIYTVETTGCKDR